VGKKAAKKSIKKRRRQPRRRTLPPEEPVAENLPRGKTSENLPPLIGPMEPPSWWSRERLREQYEEQERSARSASPSRVARKVIARAAMGVVTVESATTKDSTKEAILQFAARKWAGWV